MNRNRFIRCCFVGVAAALLGASATLDALGQRYSISIGGSYAMGDYIFSERTHSVTLDVSGSVRSGRVFVVATVPFVYQDSPWISATAVGFIPSGGPESSEVARRRQSPSGGGSGGTGSGGTGSGGTGSGGTGSGGIPPGGTASGGTGLPEGGFAKTSDTTDDIVVVEDTTSYAATAIGDPYISMSYAVVQKPGTAISLSVSAKVPIADVDRGFGTGKFDVGTGASGMFWRGAISALVNVGYWHMGDMSDLELNDVATGGLGIGYRFATSWSFLVSLSGSTPIVDGTDAPASVRFGATRFFGSGAIVAGYTSVGLTESAPRFQAGITVTTTL